MTTDVEAFIEHYGVPGMTWGKRKQRPGPSKDSKRATQIRKKGKIGTEKALTNKEIEEFARRINLEQKYSKLTPGKRKMSTNKVIAIAASVNAAFAFANSAAGRSIANKIKNTADGPINLTGPLTKRRFI